MMKIKTQIKQLDHYDVHERSYFTKVGALVLAAATVVSMLGDHDATKRQARSEIITNANVIVASPAPAEKNEMIRMPIKFDDGLRTAVTTGA